MNAGGMEVEEGWRSEGEGGGSSSIEEQTTPSLNTWVLDNDNWVLSDAQQAIENRNWAIETANTQNVNKNWATSFGDHALEIGNWALDKGTWGLGKHSKDSLENSNNPNSNWAALGLERANWTTLDDEGNWTDLLAAIGGNWSTVGGNWSGMDGNWTDEAYKEFILTSLTASILGVLILTTIVGNVFVIAAILLERNLQSVANYLILSLAVADLLVAALVMPLGAVYEVSKEWMLGPELCDMWTASDVLCCTASILHLVAIALDRFWAVTNVDYIHRRSQKRIGSMIAAIWIVSFLVSAAPMMGWKDPEWHERLRNNMCLISQAVSYQIFATITSFYLPLFVILVLYWKVYQAARKRIRRKIGNNANTAAALCRVPMAITSESTTFNRLPSQPSPDRTSNGSSTLNGHTAEPVGGNTITSIVAAAASVANFVPRQQRRRDAESRKERKAAKTLAIITGAFVMCWLPFFSLALVMPLCKESCDFSPHLIATFLWLGYFNSTLNPIIYTVFSPEFRNAFKRILCGRKRLNRHNSRFSSMRFARS